MVKMYFFFFFLKYSLNSSYTSLVTKQNRKQSHERDFKQKKMFCFDVFYKENSNYLILMAVSTKTHVQSWVIRNSPRTGIASIDNLMSWMSSCFPRKKKNLVILASQTDDFSDL